MLRIIWPLKAHADPTLLCRLGRVLHWAATTTAIAWLFGFAFMAFTDQFTGRLTGELLFMVVMPAFLLCAAGRATRYVLGAE